MVVRVVVAGRGYDTAARFPESLALAEHATLDDALAELNKCASGAKGLPASCLVAVCGTHLGTVGAHRARVLQDGDELLLLAPVAGG